MRKSNLTDNKWRSIYIIHTLFTQCLVIRPQNSGFQTQVRMAYKRPGYPRFGGLGKPTIEMVVGETLQPSLKSI